MPGTPRWVQIATMPGPGLSFWGNQIWGKPYVDLNFALKASLTIARSVFGAKTNPKLQAELIQVLEEYQAILEKTEILFAEKLVELAKKRDELEKRKVKDGFFRIVRNFFLTISSKTHDFRAKRKQLYAPWSAPITEKLSLEALKRGYDYGKRLLWKQRVREN